MKIENGYLIIEPYEYIRNKKITGHSFVDLLGLNNFKKPGDTLLTMHGFVAEKVDEKWLKRGDFAEKIVYLLYTQKYKKRCITYDKQVIKWDNFQEKKNFGGLIDIELLDDKSLIEVKSKSLKDYEYICENQPLNEVYQGEYYAFLRGYETFKMEWIFFDPITEEEIFSGKKPTTLKNIRRFSKEYKVNFKEMEDKTKEALTILENFRKERKIPLDQISEINIEKLKESGRIVC